MLGRDLEIGKRGEGAGKRERGKRNARECMGT